jgi:hypothetical protein
MAASFKMTVFIVLMMGAVRTSETSVYFNKTTLRYIPEGYLSSSYECSVVQAIVSFPCRQEFPSTYLSKICKPDYLVGCFMMLYQLLMFVVLRSTASCFHIISLTVDVFDNLHL